MGGAWAMGAMLCAMIRNGQGSGCIDFDERVLDLRDSRWHIVSENELSNICSFESLSRSPVFVAHGS
jgi:hypothetical protein